MSELDFDNESTNDEVSLWANERRCPICKKHFYPPTYHWAYKMNNTYFCSWKCYRIGTTPKKKEETKYNGKIIQKLSLDGKEVLGEYRGTTRAGLEVGVEASCIGRACRTGRTSKGFKWRYKEDGLS